jgi:hypothetical protein
MNNGLRFKKGYTRREALKKLSCRTYDTVPAIGERLGGGPLD